LRRNGSSLLSLSKGPQAARGYDERLRFLRALRGSNVFSPPHTTHRESYLIGFDQLSFTAVLAKRRIIIA
jgi:hypothetical protein